MREPRGKEMCFNLPYRSETFTEKPYPIKLPDGVSQLGWASSVMPSLILELCSGTCSKKQQTKNDGRFSSEKDSDDDVVCVYSKLQKEG